MRASDVMVRGVATTTPDTTVEKVARLMINLRISGVPVLDREGQLVGIVTEGDLLRRARPGPSAGARAGASGLPQIRDWRQSTSSRTPGGWRTS